MMLLSKALFLMRFLRALPIKQFLIMKLLN